MPRRTKPDAIALIKEDHRKVEKLFGSFEKARDEDRKKALAREISGGGRASFPRHSFQVATSWLPSTA